MKRYCTLAVLSKLSDAFYRFMICVIKVFWNASFSWTWDNFKRFISSISIRKITAVYPYYCYLSVYIFNTVTKQAKSFSLMIEGGWGDLPPPTPPHPLLNQKLTIWRFTVYFFIKQNPAHICFANYTSEKCSYIIDLDSGQIQ